MKVSILLGAFAVALFSFGVTADETVITSSTDKAAESISITVLGEVKEPGIYEVPKWATLIEAIAVARGYTDFADARRIKIYRENEDGKLEVSVHNLRTLEGLDVKTISLRQRDKVVVPQRSAFPDH